jgi:hypothetical protein
LSMCPRCGKDVATKKRRAWCPDCERAYDGWVRQHATDIMWVVLGGGIVLGAAALMPVMGFSPIFALCGGFLGWGTILTASRLNARRRRQQFLRGGDLPRAYLPAPK